MVASLRDQFSTYFTPAEYKRFQQGQQHSFSGIGTTVRQSPLGLTITGVYPGSPAARARLRRGDVITAVGQHPLRGRKDSYSVALIKGRDGTPVS